MMSPFFTRITSRLNFLVVFLIIVYLFGASYMARAAIQPQGVSFSSGAVIFPIGLYNVKTTVFRELVDAGFNTVHIYNYDKDYLNKYFYDVQRHGLRVLAYPGTRIESDKFYDLRNVAKNVASLKADILLAWQLSDEPELQNIKPGDINAMREEIVRADPFHPTAVIISKSGRYNDYAATADILMVDPYPVPDHPLTLVSDAIEKARFAVQDKKPVWAILQAFGYQNSRNKGWGRDREPTFEEERCMTYLAIVHGAKGIFYYTYHGSQYFIELSPEHWKGIKRLASELRDLTPVLLAPAGPSVLKIEITPDSSRKDANGDPAIHYMVKELDGKGYLIAVNVVEKPLTAAITGFSSGTGKIDVLFEKGRQVPVIDDKFTDDFAPYAVHIYSTQ